jgi:2-dehydro-3-deoxyphosphogluconate aldolase/(4S)-4-hydroxy-2-oxoglutarate aldolase
MKRFQQEDPFESRAQRALVLPLIPGVATPSEMMQAREAGAYFQKFFPAEPLSGAAFLRSVAEPLPDIHFWPTGGITDNNIIQYLSLANVLGVGSSHLAPRNDIQHGHWFLIEERARKSLKLACDC